MGDEEDVKSDTMSCDHDVEAGLHVKHGDHICKVVNGTKLHKYNHETGECDEHGDLYDSVELSESDFIRKYHIDNKYISHAKSISKSLYIFMIVLIFLFFIVEIVVGVWIGSIALQTDAFHMLSDFFALIIGLIAKIYASKKQSERVTFGYIRAEIIGSLVNSTFLLALCLTIIISVIQRFLDFRNSELAEETSNLMIVASIGLAINILGLVLFHFNGSHSHSHGNGNHSHNHSLNDKGVMLHMIGDTLGSVGVILTGIIIRFVDSEYALLADPICSVLIVIIIAYNSIQLFRKSVSILMHTVPFHIDIKDMKDKITSLESVEEVHNFHIWALDENKYYSSLHILLKEKEHSYQVIDLVKNILHDNGIHASTIQPEFHDHTTRSEQCRDVVCDDLKCNEVDY